MRSMPKLQEWGVSLYSIPHGGTFEIPELTVNNRTPASKDLLGRATDAVGINSKVAERLSGADFDGDAVLVIPNGNSQIKSSAPLRDLQVSIPNDTTTLISQRCRTEPSSRRWARFLISSLT